MNWIKLTAQFDSKCRDCTRQIHEGETIYGTTDMGGKPKWYVICPNCMNNRATISNDETPVAPAAKSADPDRDVAAAIAALGLGDSSDPELAEIFGTAGLSIGLASGSSVAGPAKTFPVMPTPRASGMPAVEVSGTSAIIPNPIPKREPRPFSMAWIRDNAAWRIEA